MAYSTFPVTSSVSNMTLRQTLSSGAANGSSVTIPAGTLFYVTIGSSSTSAVAAGYTWAASTYRSDGPTRYGSIGPVQDWGAYNIYLYY